MTKAQLILKLKRITRDVENYGFWAESHKEMDKLLLEYINDSDISKAFNSLEKEYV